MTKETNSLTDLAARCEAAEGPDRELSAAIALAVHDWLHEVDGNKPLNCRLRNKSDSPVYIGGVSTHMDYTASLDAAMTLVPECPEWSIHGGGWLSQYAYIRNGQGGVDHSGFAATPALALCAAALRARSAQS